MEIQKKKKIEKEKGIGFQNEQHEESQKDPLSLDEGQESQSILLHSHSLPSTSAACFEEKNTNSGEQDDDEEEEDSDEDDDDEEEEDDDEGDEEEEEEEEEVVSGVQEQSNNDYLAMINNFRHEITVTEIELGKIRKVSLYLRRIHQLRTSSFFVKKIVAIYFFLISSF